MEKSSKKITFIDSHAHLDFPDYGPDLDSVIERANAAGVARIITVGTSLAGSRSSLELARKYPFIYATAGVHPHEAGEVRKETCDGIKALLQNENVLAVGEVGLDYHYDHSSREVQREVFRRFIALSREAHLPLVIHTREAERDTLEILRSEKAGEEGGVIHCFSGTPEMAVDCIKLGFYISIPGIVTFRKATNIHEVVRKIPIEKMLIETDSPYLAPVPYRGKRNEPSYVVKVAEKIAELKGLSLEDVARITTMNTEKLFRIGNLEKAKIAYRIRDSLYLNITSRCTNACPFCPKNRDFVVKGHYLELERDPDFAEIISAIDDPSPYEEVVFCGFGEPLLRLDVIKEVAAWLKEKGAKVRINTDGLANAVYKRNILPELDGLIDALSVSLNADTPELYDKICRPPFTGAYEAVKDFIKEAGKHIPHVTASVVGIPNLDIEKCRKIAEEELGAAFRLRPLNEVG
ncbi:MAG: YchF/TatD family DNA exonuclease [Deltaproteobacteria bacterium]|nr:YchF/TatD family DNA exonuclease [Deltaproteobacteria bacterium]